MSTYPDLKPFIVHGHDHEFRDKVVGHLRGTLGMAEPVILDGVASAGLTVIEKFEQAASICNLAVVLLTPDDSATTSDGVQYRTARPNVWVELGYFIAIFGRKTGRTILVYRHGLDIPTDLGGLVYIDATAGLDDPNVCKNLEMEFNQIVNSGRATLTAGPALAGGTFQVDGSLRLMPI